jgi:hypothetical protein
MAQLQIVSFGNLMHTTRHSEFLHLIYRKMAVTDRLYPTHRIKDPARTELGKNGMSSGVNLMPNGTIYKMTKG